MTPALQDGPVTVFHGDALDVLREMADESVHMVLTSPPYWGLRDYGTASWVGGDEGCDHAHLAGGTRNQGRDRAASGGMFHDSPRVEVALAVPYRDICGKCGAKRVDSQLGLESTPDEYVENMVRLFREVRRVLRSDGTCWLNLGDSYASGGEHYTGRNDGDRETPGGRGGSFRGGERRATGARDGLKPKDLCLMPFRVAHALQQPYYLGRLRGEGDRRWLAAMVDAEGCIYINRHPMGSPTGRVRADGLRNLRKGDCFGPGLKITNTSRILVERVHELTNVGTVIQRNREGQRDWWEWTVVSDQARDLLRELYPYLIAKRQEARLAIAAPSSGTEAKAAWEALKAIHHTGMATFDLPEPASMWEPGWYIRSDVIWSKGNPMPESVSDRPTTAHEHVFLLTRSPRYFFDQDAVREEYAAIQGGVTSSAHPEDATGLLGRSGRGDGGLNGKKQHNPAGRNLRSVWQIATQPYSEAHFATFPEQLCLAPIKAGTSERGCCPDCRAPWRRVVERTPMAVREGPGRAGLKAAAQNGTSRTAITGTMLEAASSHTTGWEPTCACGNEATVPCVVLDPFAGSGTTLAVARRLGRRAIGIELSQSYIDTLIRPRISGAALPLLEFLQEAGR